MQRKMTTQWTDAMQADYDLYIEKQIKLRQQEEAYKALSLEKQKAEEAAIRDRFKVNTLSLDSFKRSDLYHKMSEGNRKEVLESAKTTGSTAVTVLYFNNEQDAQAFAKKHGVKLIKVESLIEDRALDSKSTSNHRPGSRR
jgi:hypothetical protein